MGCSTAGGWYWGDVPNSNVTVVALNTLLWYKSNNHTDHLPDYAAGALDPGNQFSWIDSLLTDLEERERRVSSPSRPYNAS